MKRKFILTIIACGASLALCPGLRAQDATPAPATTTGTAGGAGEHHRGPGGAGDQLEHLTKALDLTADQQAKIKPILDTLHTQVQAIRQDTTLDRQAQMPKIKDARDAANTQINAILTPDQQTKFAALQQKMHDHRHGGAEGQPSASPVATP
jgi:Spy/CpxP family protein refolding chaperone